jgi:hypothetical protein
MAPEQLKGLGTTTASDMYGFGAPSGNRERGV